MIGMFLFFSVITGVKISALPEGFHTLGVKMQVFCANLAPASPYRELYNALVCGVPVQNYSISEIFRITGLIHILVVSGSHLTWVHQLLRFLPNWVSVPLLTVYAFFTGFAPPVARSFWQRLLVWKTKRRLTLPLQIAFSSAWTWALIPTTTFGLSLQLSWACAILLGMCYVAGWSQPWIQCSVLFLGLYPLLSNFQILHPGTILLNLSLAGVFGALLFPLCLLCFVIPSAILIVDPVWTVLLYGLNVASLFLSTKWQYRRFDESFGWMYVITLQILFYLWDLYLKRRRCY